MSIKKTNRFIAIFTAIIICMLSFCVYSLKVNGSTVYRYYWRHDYSNPLLSSYTRYALASYTTNSNREAVTRAIIGDNDMVEDYNTSVVKLNIGGTGFIIGEHVIATAAHCVYNQETDCFLDNLTIDICDSSSSVIETITPLFAHVPEYYAQANNYTDGCRQDYALLYVEEDLTNYGMFKMGTALDEFVSANSNVTVSGFPLLDSTIYPGYPYGTRYKASGALSSEHTDEYFLGYFADTIGGDSGGPVYVEENLRINNKRRQYKTVVAINVADCGSWNIGVRVNSDILRFYYSNSYKTA